MVKKSFSLVLFLLVMLLHACTVVPVEPYPKNSKIPDTINSEGQPIDGMQSTPAPGGLLGTPTAIPPDKSTVFNSPVGTQHKQKTRSAAVVALLDISTKAERRGDFGQAASSVERSLRIAPYDASLWHRLARIRFAQKQYAQTISLAKKSNNLGTGYSGLLRKNWFLIADAYAELGNIKSSQNARQQAQKN